MAFFCYFDNIGNMEISTATALLAALGNESRLTVFRLLVEAGPEGRYASAIGEALGMPAATLSFHLAHLSRAGLILATKEGRYIRYCADYKAMNALIAFLTRDCCKGNPHPECLVMPTDSSTHCSETS